MVERSGEGALPRAKEECALYDEIDQVIGARPITRTEAEGGDGGKSPGATPTREDKAAKRVRGHMQIAQAAAAEAARLIAPSLAWGEGGGSGGGNR